MTKKIFTLFSLIITSGLWAQPQVPEEYFQEPLDVPLVLSGTFGELRSNHFHSGLDIKTQQREGLNVIAAAGGFVSRINVQHYGYGKALYIQHPNGYTTVYGHLKEFSPEIEAYIKKIQYAQESYEVEIYPEAGVLPVNQGDLVAYSGNTGGSGGPHLHFEIRDGNQRPMNPKLFGINVKDSQPPTINSLYAYPIGEDAHVNGSTRRQRIRLIPLNDGSFRTEQIDACGEIGFGISAIDKQDAAANNNGVYRVQANLNGDVVFDMNMDRFSFNESRHLNQLIDYEYYANNRSRVKKLFVGPNNHLSIYNTVVDRGIVNVQDSLNYIYSIKVTDFSGNEKMVRVQIQGKQPAVKPEKRQPETDYFVQANQAFNVDENGIDAYIPKGSLYDDTYLDIKFQGDTIYFHKDDTPIHSNITLGFNVSDYPQEEREKMFIARLGYGGRPSYNSTTKKGDRFTTGIRTFGTYTLAKDTRPPSITPVNFKNGQWISGNSTLVIRIADDLSGIKSYRATVNGKFILMEYEYKNNTLTHKFSDGVVTDTENNLKVIVTDNVGNSSTYEATFFRK
ncbi:M23 family metallopeptidase [Antarcticibacterium flavum]|uniref:M23 family metallopeptidase n=1 Tax=Antarcticibacterium flavum TaxID=2058175 RepID=A0A5B7X130_9FLAO|nr:MULTISPECIES: M23 family metallopeptidase [Antarcticibacterium]MCM4161183.1 peptidase M23 [Antarcticibacterium sp. W02-3]QCY68313.1 M23 family metallopeptidase [Antarcticibacterium flavum]